MQTSRLILCIDLDAFFASVEELLHPEWRGQPIVVGGRPDERGVVSSCTYAARKFGVRSAMPMSRALQLCPQAIRAPAHFDLYHEYSQRVMRIVHEYGCPVEQVSVDEVFLDASECVGAWGSAAALAADMRRRIRAEVGLTCTVGIASSKLVAKIASNQGKPDGLLDVPAGQEAQFLAPLPIGQLWGVGPKHASALQALELRTIGDVQRAPLKRLETVFGVWAEEWQRKAHGVDKSTVETSRETKSVSRETTFVKDVADVDELKRVLLDLSEQVARDLRNEGLHARTVAIKLRWPNFETITRQSTLERSTDSAGDIYGAAALLLDAAVKSGRKVRLLGVRATNLAGGHQLSLFGDTSDRQERLDRTLDDLHERFGDDALRRAALVRKREEQE